MWGTAGVGSLLCSSLSTWSLPAFTVEEMVSPFSVRSFLASEVLKPGTWNRFKEAFSATALMQGTTSEKCGETLDGKHSVESLPPPPGV